jgi:hypothetical protein
MNIFNAVNHGVQKMDWLDMAMVKIACFAFGILLAIFIPRLTEISVWWIIAVWLLAAIRPVYRFFH